MKRIAGWLGAAVFIAFAGWLLLRLTEQEGDWTRLALLYTRPAWLGTAVLCYTVSFLLKAWACRLYSGGKLGWSRSVQGLFASLFVNHVLPVKAGDLVRAGIAAREPGVGWDEGLHYVAAMRSLDLLTLGAIAAAGGVLLGQAWPGDRYVWFMAALAASAVIAGSVLYLGPRAKARSYIGKHLGLVRSVWSGKQGAAILILTAVSWVLEGAVLFGAARALGVELGFPEAVWVTAMTVAGQVFHFTPGGLGTYESVMSASLAAGAGMPLQTAFTIALSTHGFKFAYSYAAGLIWMWRSAVSWEDVRAWTAFHSRITGITKNREGDLR